MNSNVCDNQFLPTWIFSWVLSLTLRPTKPLSNSNENSNLLPAMRVHRANVLHERNPWNLHWKKEGSPYNIQWKHRMHVLLVAKYDFETLLNLSSSIFADEVYCAMLLFTRPTILYSIQVTQRTVLHYRDHRMGTILLQERLFFFCFGARKSISMRSMQLFIDRGHSFECLKKLFSHPMHSITLPQGLGLTLLIYESVHDKEMFISILSVTYV